MSGRHIQVESRAAANQQVQGLRTRLLEIRSTFARGSEGILDRQLRYRGWWEEARAAVLRLFGDLVLAEQVCPAPVFIPPDASIDARFRDVDSQIDRAFDRLGALLQDLDQPEEGPLTTPATEAPSRRLEPEQDGLLAGLTEAARRVPRSERASFLLLRTQQSDLIIHPGLSNWDLQASLGDLRILDRAGLIALSEVSSTSYDIDVMPEGFAYSDQMRMRTGEPVLRLESDVVRHLDAEGFRSRHPGSYARWAAAAERLRSDDSAGNLTVIGHNVRESMQFFADELVRRFPMSSVNPDPAKTVDRVRAVIRHRSAPLGDIKAAVLEAAIVFWGTVSDLAQRQEHGALKEGDVLTTEDARRLVFLSALVMFEIDAALEPA
jgi:hypothetical protein